MIKRHLQWSATISLAPGKGRTAFLLLLVCGAMYGPFVGQAQENPFAQAAPQQQSQTKTPLPRLNRLPTPDDSAPKGCTSVSRTPKKGWRVR